MEISFSIVIQVRLASLLLAFLLPGFSRRAARWILRWQAPGESLSNFIMAYDLLRKSINGSVASQFNHRNP
jgi:hypothetical protein